jgi:RNA polymerase sigma-70 factor (ECF subfamily)
MEVAMNNLGLGAEQTGRPKLMGMSDFAFSEENWRLESARLGDREALEKLLDPLRPKLTAFFARRVRNADEAENLAQQTLFQAYQRLGEFRNECPFDRWVWCIAGNIAVQYFRRQTRDSKFTTDLAEDDGALAVIEESSVHAGQWLKELVEAAKQACSKQEFTVLMTYYQVGSFEKVASLLELNAATVRSNFLRGRSALLAYLIRFCPDSVGGHELIVATAKRLLESPTDQGLDLPEYDALMKGSYPSRAHRSACVKIARVLPNPFKGN